mmetsp:Transcript_2399/g.5440  ORF Transcript_2399/g.5440 Transcript_2399/m.5440 type:complete len:144 (+) Transcript_2399:372-803(+)
MCKYQSLEFFFFPEHSLHVRSLKLTFPEHVPCTSPLCDNVEVKFAHSPRSSYALRRDSMDEQRRKQVALVPPSVRVALVIMDAVVLAAAAARRAGATVPPFPCGGHDAYQQSESRRCLLSHAGTPPQIGRPMPGISPSHVCVV